MCTNLFTNKDHYDSMLRKITMIQCYAYMICLHRYIYIYLILFMMSYINKYFHAFRHRRMTNLKRATQLAARLLWFTCF